MSLIERAQKRVLTEEAAKKGIKAGQLRDIPDIYDELLGLSDIGEPVYGRPMAPFYRAVEEEPVEVDRIAKFITGLARDVMVGDVALMEAEDSLANLGLELWARAQMAKNRSMALTKAAHAERNRAALGGTWGYSDGLSDASRLDMEKTTAWLDASEGTATIPANSSDRLVPPHSIRVVEEDGPLGGDLLGSRAWDAFDGLENSNWRALFSVPGTTALCVVEIEGSPELNAVQLDPVGFGVEFKLEIDAGNGFEEAVQGMLHRKTTYPLRPQKVRQLRLSFTVADTVLPKTCGLRSVRLFTREVDRPVSASVYTIPLFVDRPFSDIRVNYEGKIPEGSRIVSYFSLDGTNWTKVEKGSWTAVRNTNTSRILLSGDPSADRGLFSYPVSNGPLAATEGALRVGVQQYELSAFRKDYTERGESPHLPDPSDFAGATHNEATTWLSPGPPTRVGTGLGRLVQTPNENVYDPPQNLKKGAGVLAFQQVASGEQIADLSIVALAGGPAYAICQPNYTYRLRFQVHAKREVFFDNGKYWLLQGYRTRNAKTYREIGKSYGAFTMVVNGQVVASDQEPYTVYRTAVNNSYLEAGGDNGKPFSFSLRAGWNTVEILLHTVDPASYGSDAYDAANPYLQLSVYPSLFHDVFQRLNDIDQVVASGERKAVSEFDLLWNLPPSPVFWAWGQDRRKVLFNLGGTEPVDGYLAGGMPISELLYKGEASTTQTQQNLHLRFDLVREDEAAADPILDSIEVVAR